jgi:3-hydroxyacyl-[acyl-carrier protein] dehydratase/trans-2-decenoyl-[acyl-carrier protein] isomerase
MSGALGTGRALGCGEVDFFGQIRPHDKLVRYEVDIIRYQNLPSSGSSIAIGDARVLVDGEEIYRDPDYPFASRNSRGGRMGE